MASKYVEFWLPAVLWSYIDATFYERYCLCSFTVFVNVNVSRKEERCMAMPWSRYRRIMSKYYWSVIVAFSMTMFVVLYCCFNEDASTDGRLSNNLNVFENVDFDGPKIPSTSAEYLQEKELTTIQCNDLYETAMDMLKLGERVPLPFQTNNTRWAFRKRGNLDYLEQTSRRWGQPHVANFSSWNFADYDGVKSKDIKAKKYFITFACNCCEKSKIKAIKSARDPGGFDFTTIHNMDSLSKRFKSTHSAILAQKRGCGYWLWKPYIILQTFIESMSDNDLLMYQDAGAHLIGDAGPLLKLCQELDLGILVFHTEFLEKVFTKRDAYILTHMDDARVYESYQRLASFMVLRKNCQSLQFVLEWLAYASDPRILTDIDNQMGKPDLPTFKENRHDQTVLSLLSKKWQLEEFRDPSQYGNVERRLMYALGPYKQLINHTRDTS